MVTARRIGIAFAGHIRVQCAIHEVVVRAPLPTARVPVRAPLSANTTARVLRIGVFCCLGPDVFAKHVTATMSVLVMYDADTHYKSDISVHWHTVWNAKLTRRSDVPILCGH